MSLTQSTERETQPQSWPTSGSPAHILHMHTSRHVLIHMYMYTSTGTCTCTHAQVHVHTHRYMYMYTCTGTCTCTHAQVHVVHNKYYVMYRQIGVCKPPPITNNKQQVQSSGIYTLHNSFHQTISPYMATFNSPLCTHTCMYKSTVMKS